MPDQTPLPDSEVRETTGRERLVASLRRPGSRGQLTAAVLLAVLGFAAVVQVHANDKDDRYAGASQQDLIQLINTLQLATDRTERQISDLEATRDALRSDTADNQTALSLARRQASSLGILAGALPAEGPGIEVTVDGPAGAVGTEQLLNGIQELRDAGAEAMQINNAVRIVAQSAISDGPRGSVMIDGKQVEAPFVIDVIGNQQALSPAVFFKDGFADKVRDVGGDVKVRELDDIKITTTRAVETPRYAKPNG